MLSSIASDNGFQIDDAKWGAHLELAAPIQTENLNVERRLACLSPVGVHLLLQRIVCCDTRCIVKERLIADAIAPKLDELETLQDWNEELVAPRNDGSVDLHGLLIDAALEFEGVLQTLTTPDGTPLRTMLDGGDGASYVRRILTRAIRDRRADA